MEYLIAIDGGGTKTDVVLFTQDGTVARRCIAGPCNPVDVGFEQCKLVLQRIADDFALVLNAEDTVSAVFAGISGGSVSGNRIIMKKLLHKVFSYANIVESDSDGISALSAGVGAGQDGCVIICGTGISGFVRKAGQVSRVAGWGYLFDKGASGFDFGRDAVQAGLSAFDGCAEKTILTELLNRELGMPVQDAVNFLYTEGKKGIAALAPLVFEAWEQKDKVAGEIIARNMKEMGVICNELSARAEVVPCLTVLAGSVFNSFHILRPFLQVHLKQKHDFLQPLLPPVYGSALEAIALAKVQIANNFEDAFENSLCKNMKKIH